MWIVSHWCCCISLHFKYCLCVFWAILCSRILFSCAPFIFVLYFFPLNFMPPYFECLAIILCACACLCFYSRLIADACSTFHFICMHIEPNSWTQQSAILKIRRRKIVYVVCTTKCFQRNGLIDHFKKSPKALESHKKPGGKKFKIDP